MAIKYYSNVYQWLMVIYSLMLIERIAFHPLDDESLTSRYTKGILFGLLACVSIAAIILVERRHKRIYQLCNEYQETIPGLNNVVVNSNNQLRQLIPNQQNQPDNNGYMPVATN
jgi:hypothetical protein